MLYSFVERKGGDKGVLDVERRILDIDKTLCDNIDLLDFQNVTRALVSQNLLSQSRNLVEHIAVKERRARSILADMCKMGYLKKQGATSNLKYILDRE